MFSNHILAFSLEGGSSQLVLHLHGQCFVQTLSARSIPCTDVWILSKFACWIFGYVSSLGEWACSWFFSISMMLGLWSDIVIVVSTTEACVLTCHDIHLFGILTFAIVILLMVFLFIAASLLNWSLTSLVDLIAFLAIQSNALRGGWLTCLWFDILFSNCFRVLHDLVMPHIFTFLVSLNLNLIR